MLWFYSIGKNEDKNTQIQTILQQWSNFSPFSQYIWALSLEVKVFLFFFSFKYQKASILIKKSPYTCIGLISRFLGICKMWFYFLQAWRSPFSGWNFRFSSFQALFHLNSKQKVHFWLLKMPSPPAIVSPIPY
jgi:hypothetical protein